MLNDDNTLVNETLKGKIEAFGMLVEKYQNIMFNLAYQITHDSDSSKDITQDVFIKAYNKMKYFDTGKKFFSWIYRITLNESLNQNKRSGFTDILNDETEGMTDSTVSDMEQNELTNNVNAAVNRLDEKYRTLIVLKHYQDLSYDEISDILNIPVGKVKSRLYIAREYLRKSLEGIY